MSVAASTTESIQKFIRPEVFPSTMCPGCGHGILMGAILRAIDELGLDIDRMLFVSGIGCGGWIPSPHFAVDTLHTTHGRPIAFATGAKLFNPDLNVVVIGGDGDLAAIGGNHLIHAARRNLDMTVICANNQIYGMTGGQVTPTTDIGMITVTTPNGNEEPPFDLSRLVEAAGASFVARWSVYHIRPLIRTLKEALQHKGFAFVEVLSSCPTQLGRRNQMGDPFEMLQRYKRICVPKDRAAKMTAEELAEKIVVGRFK
jgi:2-oxoglutarate ferredoxin oxidoreductase subunit beta